MCTGSTYRYIVFTTFWMPIVSETHMWGIWISVSLHKAKVSPGIEAGTFVKPSPRLNLRRRYPPLGHGDYVQVIKPCVAETMNCQLIYDFPTPSSISFSDIKTKRIAFTSRQVPRFMQSLRRKTESINGIKLPMS